MSLYEILIKDDVIKSINENITEILELIPELKNLIGFEHKHPHHPDKLEKRKEYLKQISSNL